MSGTHQRPTVGIDIEKGFFEIQLTIKDSSNQLDLNGQKKF